MADHSDALKAAFLLGILLALAFATSVIVGAQITAFVYHAGSLQHG